MKKITLLISALMLTVATSFAQTWNIGKDNDEDVTATLSGETLTISGTGAMKNYNNPAPFAPWFYDNSSFTNVIIEEGVTTIGNFAFYNCRLTSISIPASVTNIGMYAFQHSDLNSITISSSITSIGYQAFTDCDRLAAIDVNSANNDYSSENGVLFNKNKTGLIRCPPQKTGDYVIPNGVTNIADNAFDRCNNLTSISIPSSVTNIGIYAFYGCNKVTSFIIPEGITSIKNYVFYSCSGLTSISIPNNVTSIGESAFLSCGKLTSVTIPSGVTSIGENAFRFCSSLTSVTNYALTPQSIIRDVFNGLTLSNITLYVPAASLALYQKANVWKEFNIVAMPMSGVNDILLNGATIVGYYSVLGAKLPKEPENGLYIIMYDNGKVEKVLK